MSKASELLGRLNESGPSKSRTAEKMADLLTERGFVYKGQNQPNEHIYSHPNKTVHTWSRVYDDKYGPYISIALNDQDKPKTFRDDEGVEQAREYLKQMDK